MTLRLAFMGTPHFATPSLAQLMIRRHQIACVYTQPPRPKGRGLSEAKSPVHKLAESLRIEVRTPRSLKDAEEQEAFAALKLDAAIVVAYGLILPKAVLDAPRLGPFNLHASLLPRWRGAAPIQRAIMAGDAVTGVQVMRMEEGLDTGPVLASVETSIGAEDNAASVLDRLSAMGAVLLIETLAAIERGEVSEAPQSEAGVTYAHKITPADARIDWTQTA